MFIVVVVCVGTTAYAAVMKNMGGFGVMNMSNNSTEASSLTPRSKLPPPSMGSIPEIDDVKPVFSSRLPPRTLSGGFNQGSASSKRMAIARTQSGGLDQYKTKVCVNNELCSVSVGVLDSV